MTGAATHRPATPPGTSGWQIRPARPADAAAVAAGVAALLCELGATPPAHSAIEAEARAHIDDPSLGIVLIATPTRRVRRIGPVAKESANSPAGATGRGADGQLGASDPGAGTDADDRGALDAP